MRSLLPSIFILLIAVGFFAAPSVAQNAAPAAKPTMVKPGEKAPEKLGTHATENLPSEATVDSFLHQQFGYQADLTWKISSIKPSPIEGLAEVTVGGIL